MDSKTSPKNISEMESPQVVNTVADTPKHTLATTSPKKPRSRGKRTPGTSPALRSKTPTKDKKDIPLMTLDNQVPIETSEKDDKEKEKPDHHVQILLPEPPTTSVVGSRGITFVMPEPLLEASEDRFVIFPIRHPDVWDMYKKHMSVHWVPEEVDLSKDMSDWVKLTDNERYFIKNILGFFAGSDGIVMENLATRFMSEIQWPEAKFFYACQNLLEAVHSETYSLLIDTYITDKEEKTNILKAIQTIPCVQKKAEWALQWMSGTQPFASRLLAFAAVEGIFFSGAFCAIFWLKQRGVMPGLTVSNEFIARDEGLHTDFACLLYSKLNNKLSKKEATRIIRDAVKIEKQFITKSLPCDLIGMNAELMKQYIEFVADRLLLQLGYPKAYSATNPFPFMDRIGLEGKDNFFEKRVSTYGKAHVGKDKEKMVFSTTSDF
jgi:ribonucleotide reductase beta subunit family protein with ferritin-like domain